jgi:hypothetical protein
MYILNKRQAEMIALDVEKAGIRISNLSDELMDHICCELESEMNLGKSFEDAYEKIKKQIDIRSLQKIEENTRYLTDKNYKIMKTTMKITGNISLILIALGTISKIFHWPGAGIALLLGFVLLCLLFFPSAVYLNYTEQKKKVPVLLHLSILLGGILFMAGILFKVMHWPASAMLLFSGWMTILCLFLPILLYVKLKEAHTFSEKSIYVIGVFATIIFELSAMFKMFHWPGAGILMIFGSIMLVSVFIPMFTWAKFRESRIISPQFIFIIVISVYAVILTALMSLRVSGNLLASFENDEKDAVVISKYFEEKNNQMNISNLNQSDSLRLLKEMQVSALRNSSDKLCAFIYSIKTELIRSAEGVDSDRAAYLISHPEEINNKDNMDAVKQVLNDSKGTKISLQLKEEIDKYREYLLSMSGMDNEHKNRILMLLSTSPSSIHEIKKTWENLHFGNGVLISVLSVCRQLEVQIRMAESEAITSIERIH